MGKGFVNVSGGGESENQLKELEQKLAGKVDKAGDTMTGPLCVGEHARLSNVAGDNWGTFTLDSLYGDGFARLALICYWQSSSCLRRTGSMSKEWLCSTRGTSEVMRCR